MKLVLADFRGHGAFKKDGVLPLKKGKADYFTRGRPKTILPRVPPAKTKETGKEPFLGFLEGTPA